MSPVAALQNLDQDAHLLRELRLGTERRRARLRQFDPVIEDYASRPAREHDRTLCQKSRFYDGMRDEDHGHSPFIPEGVQMLIKLLAGNLIKRGKRLIEQQQRMDS